MDLAPLPASKKVMQPPLPVLSNQVDTKQPVCWVASQQGIKPLGHKNSQVEMRSWNLDGWSYLYQSEYLGHPFQSTQDVKPYPSLPHLPGPWKQRSCTQRSRVVKDSARSDVENEVVYHNHLQSTGNRHLGNMKYNSFSFQGPWKSEPKQKSTSAHLLVPALDYLTGVAQQHGTSRVIEFSMKDLCRYFFISFLSSNCLLPPVHPVLGPVLLAEAGPQKGGQDDINMFFQSMAIWPNFEASNVLWATKSVGALRKNVPFFLHSFFNDILTKEWAMLSWTSETYPDRRYRSADDVPFKSFHSQPRCCEESLKISRPFQPPMNSESIKWSFLWSQALLSLFQKENNELTLLLVVQSYWSCPAINGVDLMQLRPGKIGVVSRGVLGSINFVDMSMHKK